jgi:hypothetical protein
VSGPALSRPALKTGQGKKKCSVTVPDTEGDVQYLREASSKNGEKKIVTQKGIYSRQLVIRSIED